jgi:circadian clock protein KaiC
MAQPIRREPETLSARNDHLTKVSTGIAGLDRITGGGLPAGRLVAIAGGPGCGKSILSLQILANRLKHHDEVGVFVSFEESRLKIRQNLAAFDWGLAEEDWDRLQIIHATGARMDAMSLLAMATDAMLRHKARNIVFDGLDVFLDGLPGEQTERQEIARISDWIASRGGLGMVTVKGRGSLDREQSREVALQYASDCVVTLDSRVTGNIVSRSLRVVKYRGSDFHSDVYPLVISHGGLEVISDPPARHHFVAEQEKIGSGVAWLDRLLGGGYLRGSCILVSGGPGTGKSSLATSLIDASCRQGQRVLLASFANQIVANMHSIGQNLEEHRESGLLQILSLRFPRRPEEQFLALSRLMEVHNPSVLVIDPLSAVQSKQYPFATMITETLLDHAQAADITTLCTSLLHGTDDKAWSGTRADSEVRDLGVETIADTWIHMAQELRPEGRRRHLTIVKSRGMAHGEACYAFRLGPGGLELLEE